MSIETEIERTAVRLARAAGARIVSAYGTALDIEFKAALQGAPANSNPVSEIDRAVEAYIRNELQTIFPQHAVIGEESGGPQQTQAQFTWVIDPLDGTTNYINGIPLFASSIGVLRAGRPFVGAIWCTTSHALQAGVYHARSGGRLHFDGVEVSRRPAARWRGIAALPRHLSRLGSHWDVRVLGSATLELALVAAGLLRLTYLSRPALWDAAAGVVLAEAAGCAVVTRQDSSWTPFSSFDRLAAWYQPLLVGDPESVRLVIGASGAADD